MRSVIVLTLLNLVNFLGIANYAYSEGVHADELYYSVFKKDSLNFKQNVRREVSAGEQKPLQKNIQEDCDLYKFTSDNPYFTEKTAYSHIFFQRDQTSSPRAKIEMGYTYYTRRCVKRARGPSPVQSYCVKWLNEPHKGLVSYDLDFSGVNTPDGVEQVHLQIRSSSQWRNKPKLKNLVIVSEQTSYKIKKKRFSSKLIITEGH